MGVGAYTELPFCTSLPSSCSSILGVAILIADIILVVVELAIGEEKFPVIGEEFLEVVALLFSAYFCAEVSLRIVGQG